jgi:hypothetical protein
MSSSVTTPSSGWTLPTLPAEGSNAGCGTSSTGRCRPRSSGEARSVTGAVMCRMTGPNDRHCRRLERQGLAAGTAPALPLRSLTSAARSRAIGNAVPWSVAVALANACCEPGSVTPADCACGCGRRVIGKQRAATPACRKRLERRRRGHTRSITIDESHVRSRVAGPDTAQDLSRGPVTVECGRVTASKPAIDESRPAGPDTLQDLSQCRAGSQCGCGRVTERNQV